MLRFSPILATLALIAINANAFYFEDIQNVYIEASDNKAYEFYVNGKFIGSGKRVHIKESKDSYCKIEAVAKIGDRIYGMEQAGKGYKRDERGRGGNLLHDMFVGSENDKGCPDKIVIDINPDAYISSYKPPIINNTNWSEPVKNPDFFTPQETPSLNDWTKSPFNKEPQQ